jgi:hypothetical protein
MPRRNIIRSVALGLCIIGLAGMALGAANLFDEFGLRQPARRFTAIEIVSPLARDGWPAIP